MVSRLWCTKDPLSGVDPVSAIDQSGSNQSICTSPRKHVFRSHLRGPVHIYQQTWSGCLWVKTAIKNSNYVWKLKKLILRKFKSEEIIEIKTRSFFCKDISLSEELNTIFHGEYKKPKQEGQEREMKCGLQHSFSNSDGYPDHMGTLLKWSLWSSSSQVGPQSLTCSQVLQMPLIRDHTSAKS